MNGYSFTQKARRALRQARNEAAALSHPYVGTEHVLLGLLAFDENAFGIILNELGVDPQQVADTLRRTLVHGQSGPVSAPDLPYTSRAKKVLELAMTEARGLRHDHVGTEHLLLGLIGEEKGIAAQELQSFDVTLDKARRMLISILAIESDALLLELSPVKSPGTRHPGAPPLDERPESVGLILRYTNGAVVTKHFLTVSDALSFLSAH
jgi:ATP-dependent Clp protease ATP-binding subunit ClpC